MQTHNQPKQDFSGLNVLLIEDDKDTREVLGALLQEIGITKINSMENAFEAKQFLRDFPDWRGIVLCDWNMPRMSGAALFRESKQSHPHLPFIMVTGRNDEDSVLFAKDSGIYAYLLKPVSMDELERKISKVAGNQPSLPPLPMKEPSYNL